MRLNKITSSPSHLDKKIVVSALDVFSSEVNSALRLEFGEKAKEIHLFLEFLMIEFLNGF